MFKRALSSAFAIRVGSVAAATAAVALTDKELSKKPEWYKDTVLKLEDSLKKTGKYRPIDSRETLDNAHDIFQRVADYNSAEIFWRLGRVLVEKCDLESDHHKQAHLLHEAVEYFHKAHSLEPAGGCGGAHKWYAMALIKLLELDKKSKHVAKAAEEIPYHLEKATKIDPKDPYAFEYLGSYHLSKKNYKEALVALKEAEEIRRDFSAGNAYNLGMVYYYSGNKDEAINHLKRSLKLPSRSMHDGKSKLRAKDFLLSKLKLKWEDIDPSDDF